jgi:hypothetical protein
VFPAFDRRRQIGTFQKEFSMYRHLLSLVILMILALPAVLTAEAEDPQQIVDRMIAAAGGEAFENLGVLKLEVSQEETRNNGTSTKSSYTLFADTTNLNNLRIEYPGDVVVARSGSTGWSTVKGVADDRPQTPFMARTTLNQAVFPLLLPYSLKMEGVWVQDVREMTIEGREVWVFAIPFAKGFFASPVLTTTWYLVIDREDYSILWLEFVPPEEYRDVSPEGIRYRILKQKELGGAMVSEQLLMVGINVRGMESGHVRVTKIDPSVVPWDVTLFVSPQQLEALEGE